MKKVLFYQKNTPKNQLDLWGCKYSELRMGNHIIDESLKKMNPLSPKTLDLIFTNYEFKLSCQNKDNSISCENTFCVNDYFSVEKFTDNLKKTINYEKFSIPTAFRDLCVFTYIYMEKGKNYIVLRIDIANLGQLKIILPCII